MNIIKENRPGGLSFLASGIDLRWNSLLLWMRGIAALSVLQKSPTVRDPEASKPGKALSMG
jgi:hypothetical protein